MELSVFANELFTYSFIQNYRYQSKTSFASLYFSHDRLRKKMRISIFTEINWNAMFFFSLFLFSK